MRRRRAREAGSLSVFVAILAVSLLMVAGLVYDGGMALAAKRRAVNVGEQAARAGAEQLDAGALLSGIGYRLQPAAATQAASSYLAAAGYSGTVTVTGTQVAISGIPWSQRSAILGAIGIQSFGGTVTARARNVHGVVTQEGP